MLQQVELCRRYAQNHGMRLIVDTQGTTSSCLPLRFGRLFQMQRCGCVVLTGLSSQEARRLNGMDAYPASFRGILDQRLKGSAYVCKIDFDKPPRAPLMVHLSYGGGNAGQALIRRERLRVNPALLTDHAERWTSFVQKVREVGGYDAVHIRHTDYMTTTYPATLEAVFSGPAERVLVCSDNPAVVAHAAEFALRHGKRLITTAELVPAAENSRELPEERSASPEVVGGVGEARRKVVAAQTPLHIQARAFTDSERAERHIIALLADMYALSHATRLHLTTPNERDGAPLVLTRPAGFSRLVGYLHAEPAARDVFFCERAGAWGNAAFAPQAAAALAANP